MHTSSRSGQTAKENQEMPKAQPAATEAEEAQATTGDTGDKPVKQQVREAFEGGKTRREIADEFELSYQRVYQLTKDMGDGEAAPRARVLVEASEKLTEAGREDLVGKSRVEAIRELFDEGMKIGDIARLLGTVYQVVFQATKAQRAALAGEEESDGDSEATNAAGDEPAGDEDDEDEDDEDAPADE